MLTGLTSEMTKFVENEIKNLTLEHWMMDSKEKTKRMTENAGESGSVVHGHVEPLEPSGEQVNHHSDKESGRVALEPTCL